MGRVIVAAAAIGAVTLIFVATRHSASEVPPAEQKPTLYVVFLDLSSSPSPEQAAFWTQVFDKHIAARLEMGDALLILGAHDNTDAAAPVFDDQSLRVGPDAGVEEVLKARRSLAALRENGMAKVREAFADANRAAATRLVEGLLRVPKDSSRNVRIVYFSDMVEDSKLANLARTPVGSRVAELAREVARAAGLQGGELHGAAVECVLDNIGIGVPPRTINSRAALRAFWGELFAYAGGKLISFDARVGR